MSTSARPLVPKRSRSPTSPASTASISARLSSRNSRLQLNEDFGVSPAKLEQLKGRILRLNVDLSKVEEKFSRGGGKGGQKVNKTSNRVQLAYPPLELHVACQRERKRSLNRFLALRELVDQIEIRISPETSERLKEIERLRKRKARASARSSEKRATPAESA